ncbi:hypothetical protein GLOTRDRAFT_129058 [Gloeophyllum trabeum ATCC 11539]|uniref:Uncharacterized protein n=1 Tax=Gloeophyllum trabeum (strain ATCC 11539 / FP-39264 / Madison 617) TaxID=670483 RepID=S7RN05_GLOTA|nr:uncharacterized protein GLOTRDRAFT_129058 [Gloeophyllum trabeum ATCC 11539]EPQ55845.1 hypothetical protein GLOTRDRAFT_129058 [Gloeophyllum trabeum ATCC 11539]
MTDGTANEGTRPSKRPRLSVPNGFDVGPSQPARKPLKRQPAPVISSFDDPFAPPKPGPKPRISNAASRPLFQPVQDPPGVRDAKGKTSTAHMKVMKPPSIQAPQVQDSLSTSEHRMRRISCDLRLPTAPNAPSTSTPTPLRNLAHIAPVLYTKPSRSNLHALPAPVLLKPPAPSGVPITSLNDMDAIVSLLQENNHEAIPDETTHLIHGSPTKKKFLRGRLADRASHILARSQTSTALFLKDPQHIRPDLCVRILRPVHFTHAPTRAHTLHSALILCNTRTDSEDTQLFSFLVNGDGQEGDFREGREVHVWRPWFPVALGEPGTEALLCSRFLVLPACP